ncbi:MAG: aspartate--tRNA(Asn) ligase [Candidatus Methanofastidiosa archaeon]|jgi:nondiscriminating aspartyl-tRNA synthetase|nr:aspartate--tRNA(Asn) ligase [Candidatus Methanofastidiosa archaeon]HOM95382.1 aspartate--tRNA(Asn) ligase [Methanofastidiosum sp.]HPC80833.1 aspartate--tRNA(Asn) ligase [Methanofastidiosum sp.]HRS25031.1 aspartate--tRNA(Asn) ligase [Methanofastidiosum sp.]
MLKRTCYSDNMKEGKEIVLTGWVHERRDLGGIKFILLRDREGIAQITAPKKKVSEEIFKLMDSLGREWVIAVKGDVKSSPQAPGGLEVIPTEIEVINTAEPNLPLDPSEKVDADIDTRLDNRFLDIRKPKVMAIFKIRSDILTAAREYLLSQAFIEIQTPKISASGTEGGTELFPISYFEREAFLAQSPQLYKQTMMATGMDRVFEMAHYFRAEESNTRRHLSESDAIDIEMAFVENEEEIMHILENLVSHMLNYVSENRKKELDLLGVEISPLPKSFRRVTYDQAISLLQETGFNVRHGEDLGTESEKALGNIIKEKYGDDLYFLTKYPLSTKPFYTNFDGNVARAFDLDYKGVEISSGGQRIHNVDILKTKIKEKGLIVSSFETYLKTFRYGMPPHGGFGLGIDRLIMQMLNLENIREAVLFPHDRRRLEP